MTFEERRKLEAKDNTGMAKLILKGSVNDNRYEFR